MMMGLLFDLRVGNPRSGRLHCVVRWMGDRDGSAINYPSLRDGKPSSINGLGLQCGCGIVIWTIWTGNSTAKSRSLAPFSSPGNLVKLSVGNVLSVLPSPRRYRINLFRRDKTTLGSRARDSLVSTIRLSSGSIELAMFGNWRDGKGEIQESVVVKPNEAMSR